MNPSSAWKMKKDGRQVILMPFFSFHIFSLGGVIYGHKIKDIMVLESIDKPVEPFVIVMQIA